MTFFYQLKTFLYQLRALGYKTIIIIISFPFLYNILYLIYNLLHSMSLEIPQSIIPFFLYLVYCDNYTGFYNLFEKFTLVSPLVPSQELSYNN